jgi:hypothetical protein
VRQGAEPEQQERGRDDVEAGCDQRAKADLGVLGGCAGPGPEPADDARDDEDKDTEQDPAGEPSGPM